MLYLQSLAGKIWLKCFFSDAWIKPIWFYQMLRLAVLCSHDLVWDRGTVPHDEVRVSALHDLLLRADVLLLSRVHYVTFLQDFHRKSF